MLKNKITLFSVLVAAVGISIAAFFVAFKGEAQTRQNDNKLEAKVLRAGNSVDAKLSKKEFDDAATPIVDYDVTNTTSSDSKRIEKSARYNNRALVKADVGTKAVEVLIDSHDLLGLSDLPVTQSDLVVEGKVIDSAAYLSNDKSAVYSEFTIRISDVVKTAGGLDVSKNDTIVMERLGGRVRYPSGKVIRYTVVEQGSPMVGKKYLFFLMRGDQNSYKILTAYEIQGNKVLALDGSQLVHRGKEGDSIFDKHNNQEYGDFKRQVEEAKNKPQNPSQNRRIVGP